MTPSITLEILIVYLKSFKKMKKKIYEGKAKILYKGKEPNTIIQYFKDDATAFNNKKKGNNSWKRCS